MPAAAQPRYEGALTQTTGDLTARARIYVQVPDRLRVEIARDDAAGVTQQIIVASGDQTLRYEPATKRLFRARFNVLKQWNRDWRLAAGGPANFAFADAKAGTFAETEGRYARRDVVLFGGGGENSYYAAAKTRAGLYPAKVELSGDKPAATAPNGAPTKRVETAVDGRQSLVADIKRAGDLPTSVAVVAAGETSVFAYDLTARAEPFDEALWTIDGAQDALPEDIDLRAPTAYGDEANAGDLFNGGVALWRGAGSFTEAQKRFVRAATLAPKASAPRLASFEMALDARDYGTAQDALAALAPLGLAPEEIEARRARLALAQRDWNGALAALDKALAVAPGSYALQLGRAQALLGRADVEGARAIWAGLSDAKIAPAARAAAAQLLAASSGEAEAALVQRALATVKDEAIRDRGGLTPNSVADFREFALALEGAGRDDEARGLWATLERFAPDAIKNQARAHLMTLAAREGNAPVSLAAYDRLRAGLTLENERENATQALFDGWQKALNREALGAAIGARAVATRAGEDDARLLLAYQEVYGDAESIESAVASGLRRAPDSAFWLGRRAGLTAEASLDLLTSNRAASARRTQGVDRARETLGRAVAADIKAGGDGLFYRQQLTLVSSQSAAKLLRSPDFKLAIAERKLASEAVEDLLKAAPNDPDVMVSAALALLSFDGTEGLGRALELAERALQSNPDDGARHTLILAARQAMAFALVKLGRFPEAAAQFELLMLESQTAGEQVGVASNYIGMLEKTANMGADDAAIAGNGAAAAAASASITARIASAPWDYADARSALEVLARRVAISPIVVPIENALAGDASGASLLAWNAIARARLARADAALLVPGAPGSADAELERTTRDNNAALAALRTFKGAVPRHVEARLAVGLAEFGGLETGSALASLQRAVAIESRAPSLRLTLADALPDDAQSAAQLKLAAQLAPDAPEIGRVLSLAALDAGDTDAALARITGLSNRVARDPNVGVNAWQRLAFARARILWEAGRTSEAVAIYNGLALPQWAETDRAAALLALRARYTGAERTAEAEGLGERIRELGLELSTLQRAASFVEEVEN